MVNFYSMTNVSHKANINQLKSCFFNTKPIFVSDRLWSSEFVSPEVTKYFCLNLGRSMTIRTTIKAIRMTIKAGPVRSTSAGLAQILIGRPWSQTEIFCYLRRYQSPNFSFNYLRREKLYGGSIFFLFFFFIKLES